METKPMPLDAMSSSAHDNLDDFRVPSPREIALILGQLCDGSVLLGLNGSQGDVFTSTIWTVDTARASIGFNADPGDPAMLALLGCPNVVVVGYLDNVKLQFDVHDLVLVRGAMASVLSCSFPREIFRFQRRNAYRVRPLTPGSRIARVRHHLFGGGGLELRVLDVSVGGCAVLLPDEFPAPALGLMLNAVQVELDADTHFEVNLQLQHVTVLAAEAHGAKLGFEFVRARGDALRALQLFIDRTQKRGKLMALN